MVGNHMVVVIVTRKYQVTIPKEIHEALNIHIGDRLVVKVVDGKIIMEPIKGWKALEKLLSIADRYFKGPKRIDIVDLIEESLEMETGIY